jgi:hypothetical protein
MDDFGTVTPHNVVGFDPEMFCHSLVSHNNMVMFVDEHDIKRERIQKRGAIESGG